MTEKQVQNDFQAGLFTLTEITEQRDGWKNGHLYYKHDNDESLSLEITFNGDYEKVCSSYMIKSIDVIKAVIYGESQEEEITSSELLQLIEADLFEQECEKLFNI